MIELQHQIETNPVCGYCKGELYTIWYHELRGAFGRRYIYFCPHCRAVLGVSHRKGFWMG